VASEQQECSGAVVVAAGSSERMAGLDKVWAPVRDANGLPRPLLAYTLAAFEACEAIDRVALVVAENAVALAQALVRDAPFEKVCAVVAGGARRQDSVRAGLDALGPCDWAVVHDGARPLVTPALIERGLAEARATGAACCALPVADTVKESDDGLRVARTLDRARLWLAQTPQVFRYGLLLQAHRSADDDATDDAALVEALGVEVRLYEGSPRNIKVTSPDDLALVEALLAAP
jgi:2-C-methyl-D-erythritol 4-phosphate cytidylyltransferase